jgi:sterol 14alpha-demethylase
MSQKTPPLVSGALPVVGHALQMLNNRETLFKRGFAEHGDVFGIKLGNQYAVVLGDKKYNRSFYQQTDKELNISDVYSFIKVTFGEVLFAAGKEAYTNQRPILQAIFKRERMEAYIKAMNKEVQMWLNGLGSEGRMDVSHEMLRLTQYVAASAFLGENFREELPASFWDDYATISKSLDMLLPANLPLPKFIRRDRATARIRAVFAKLVAERKANLEKHDDLISLLLNTPLKDGTVMSADEITTLFMGLIFAGHETTAGQGAWTIIQLLQNPDYLQEVQAEIEQKTHYGQDVDGLVLHGLDKMYWAIEETGRMRPSADLQMRIVENDMQFGDYTIPAGWRAVVSSVGSHYDEMTFSNPEVYDPLRFSPERKEGSDPFALVSFGGGMHKCTGMNFAKNEMAVITTLLFQQFELELETQDTHTLSDMGANRPSQTWIRYRRKPLQSLLDEKTIQEATAAGCPHIKSRVEAETA